MSSSLAAQLTAISDAVREVVEGQSGATRVVLQGAFKYLEFIGHPLEKQQLAGKDTAWGTNRFDLEFTEIRDNASTPESAVSDMRIVDVTIRLEFIRYVLHRDTNVSGTSLENRIAFHAQLDDVVQALGNPIAGGNLATTLAGADTGIVGGCVSAYAFTPLTRITHEIDNHLMRSEMTITAIVRVAQEI